MKNFILALCLVISFSSYAQNLSNFTISTTGNSNLKIRFNGKQYSLLDRSVTFQSLQPGNYPLTVYQLQKKGFKDEYVEVYNNTIVLAARKHMELSVLRFGKVSIDEGYIEPDNWNNGSYNPAGGNNGSNNNNNNNNGGYPVSNEQFLLLKKSMADAYYDNDKLTTGKVILKNNLFTTAQIKELLKLFYNDESKLDFAKVAYDYCTDKGNYITLMDVFYYPSNKTALLNYIKDK